MAIVESQLKFRRWGPVAPGAVFILVHGLGANTWRWEAMADFFAQRNIASYAVELGGLDIPADSRTGNNIFDEYRREIVRVCGIAGSENPDKKIFLAGESLGAMNSFILASMRPELFSGLILLAPSLSNIYKPPIGRIFQILSAFLIEPGKRFSLPFDSAMCTRDEEYAKKMDSNPMETRESSAELITEIIISQARARMIRRLSIPVLFLLAGSDSIVDSVKSRDVFNKLKAKDKQLIEFQGMYHALSIDVGKERVFEEIYKWVEKRI